MWRVALVWVLTGACTQASDVGSVELAIVGGGLESGYGAVGYLVIKDANGDWLGPICGATLIRSDLAVTAAHCIVGGQQSGATAFAIGLGAVGATPVHPATRTIVQPGYDQSANQGGGSDLALLVLGQAVAGVEPARIVDPAIGCTYRSVGYGRTITAPADSPDGYTSERKSMRLCASSMNTDPSGSADPGIILIAGQDGGLCYGDSGGAMMVEGENEIVATHSYILDETCPNQGEGGVTSVAKWLSWIEGEVGRDPTVTITSPQDGVGVAAGFTIEAAATDDLRLAQIEVTLDGTLLATGDGAAASLAATAPLELADGDHLLEARATDHAGKTATTSATVVVGEDPGAGGSSGSDAVVTGGCRIGATHPRGRSPDARHAGLGLLGLGLLASGLASRRCRA